MNKKFLTFNDILFSVLCICTLLNISNFFKSFSIVSNNYIYIFLGLLLLFSMVNFKDIIKFNNTSFAIFIILIILLLLSLIFNNGGFGSILSIILMAMILLQNETIKIDVDKYKFIFILSLLLYIYMFVYKNDNNNSNDSASATFFMFLILINNLNFFVNNHQFKSILVILFSFLECMDALHYDCRNILFATLFIFFFSFFSLSFWKKNKKYSIIWFVTSFGSIAFVFFYLYLYKIGYSIDFSFFSKKQLFSGREIIWDYMLNLFKNGNYFFGIGSHFYSNLGIIGAHNYMFSLLMLFGIPNFLLFLILLYYFFRELFTNLCKENIICMLSIVSLFLIGFAETVFISATNMSLLLMLIIYHYSCNAYSDKNIELMK